MRTWLRIVIVLMLTAVSHGCTGSMLGFTNATQLRPIVQPSRPQVLNQPAILEAQADSAWWAEHIEELVQTILKPPVPSF